MRTRLTWLAAVVALVVAACGGDGASGAISTPEYEAFRDQPAACNAERPDPPQEMQFSAPDDLALSGVVRVVLHTSCGDVTLQLFPEIAPATVNSFVFLAEQGYFDGTVFHRIAPGFVIQGGDPTATGRGGPGYRVRDEFPPAGFSYDPGIVAMANAGSGTTGSQFFIVIGANTLGPDYSVFGAVIDGAIALTSIASVPTTARPGSFEQSYPLETVYIESVTVER